LSKSCAWENADIIQKPFTWRQKDVSKTKSTSTIDDFILPFSGKLSAENRWVQLAKIIPWDEIEKEYVFMFPSDCVNVAKPVRMALGSLIIQARCGYTDRETVQQITENPNLQYFIGLKEYQLAKPFTPVALVKFRKRFNAKRLAKINELIIINVNRNLKIVDTMLQQENADMGLLNNRQQKLLETIRILAEQQTRMYKTKTHSVEDRIVNLHQPHVRPIVRGKAGAAVEFGAKVAISLEKGYSRIEKLSWDPFNEAITLQESVERYRECNDCYPEVILADRIYRTEIT